MVFNVYFSSEILGYRGCNLPKLWLASALHRMVYVENTAVQAGITISENRGEGDYLNGK